MLYGSSTVKPPRPRNLLIVPRFTLFPTTDWDPRLALPMNRLWHPAVMLCAKICACLPTWAGAGERKFTSLDSRNLTDTSQPLQMTKGFPTNRESGEKCPSIAIDDGPREPSRGDESSVSQNVSPARSNCWKI